MDGLAALPGLETVAGQLAPRVDDDVPAEQDAADDLPGVRRRVVRADVAGEGPVASGSVTPGLQNKRSWPGCWTRRICNAFTTITRRRQPVRGSAGDHVASRFSAGRIRAAASE